MAENSKIEQTDTTPTPRGQAVQDSLTSIEFIHGLSRKEGRHGVALRQLIREELAAAFAQSKQFQRGAR